MAKKYNPFSKFGLDYYEKETIIEPILTTGSSTKFAATIPYLKKVKDGVRCLLLFHTATSGAATLNVNGSGDKKLYVRSGTSNPANTIAKGHLFWAVMVGGIWFLEGSYREASTSDYGLVRLNAKVNVNEKNNDSEAATISVAAKLYQFILDLISSVTGLGETKQDKTDNSLETTNKTVSGAINELYNETGVLFDVKQNKEDSTLKTVSKTIVGAINEVFQSFDKNFKTTSGLPHYGYNVILADRIKTNDSSTDIDIPTINRSTLVYTYTLKEGNTRSEFSLHSTNDLSFGGSVLQMLFIDNQTDINRTFRVFDNKLYGAPILCTKGNLLISAQSIAAFRIMGYSNKGVIVERLDLNENISAEKLPFTDKTPEITGGNAGFTFDFAKENIYLDFTDQQGQTINITTKNVAMGDVRYFVLKHGNYGDTEARKVANLDLIEVDGEMLFNSRFATWKTNNPQYHDGRKEIFDIPSSGWEGTLILKFIKLPHGQFVEWNEYGTYGT